MTISPEQIVQEKLAQAVTLLEKHDIDLWLTFVRETSLSKDPALELIYPYDLTWHSAFLVGRGGETAAIVGRYDADNVERLGAYLHVVGYDQSIRPALIDMIRRMSPRRIALNFSESDPAADGLTFGMKRTLDETLAEAGVADSQIVASEKFLSSLRGQKSPGEIELIRQAVATTEQLYAEIGQRIRPGVTERELADYLHGRLKEMGLGTSWDWAMNPIVNTGPESIIGHAAPGDLKVQPGHLVHFDFGIKQDGFCSDIQRMWYVLAEGETEPPPDVHRTWKIVRGALMAGMMALKPGVLGWEVDAVAREYLTRHDLPEYLHAYGHNVGRVAHDGGVTLGPQWDRYGNSPNLPVEAGNVFAIELGAQVPGKGCVYLEENVLVTDDGVEWISTPQTKLKVIAL
ncbi:MAG: aminopeptidase P family protein [Chloroflexi bacterium]|nr:aminopeptidase P family protein [Chloroflexota bacterium]